MTLQARPSSRVVAAAASHEDLLRRINALEERLAFVDRRESDSLGTSQRAVQEVQNTAERMGTVLASVEAKLGRDILFLEESVEKRLREEGAKWAALQDTATKAVADEVAARERMSSSRPSASRAASPRDGDAGNTALQLKELAARIAATDGAIERRLVQLKDHTRAVETQLAQSVRGALDALDAHKRDREVSERSLLQMVEETCAALRDELATERSQRAESHKHLERVLLEAANRHWTRI